MKKIFGTMIVMLIFFTAATAGFAQASTYSVKPTNGIEADNPGLGTGYAVPAMQGSKSSFSSLSASGTYGSFQYGSCSLEWVSSGYVKGYGSTVSTMASGEVGYTLYFQMWDGYTWNDITSVKEAGYYVIDVSDFHFKTVITGKYYRVRVEHYVIDAGVKTTGTSYSSYVYVN